MRIWLLVLVFSVVTTSPLRAADGPGARSYSVGIGVDHHSYASGTEGGSIAGQTPALALGQGFHLRGEGSFGTLHFSDLGKVEDEPVRVGVTLVGLGAAFSWFQGAQPYLYPVISAEIVHATTTGDDVISRRRAFGRRLALALEVPLDHFFADDNHPTDDEDFGLGSEVEDFGDGTDQIPQAPPRTTVALFIQYALLAGFPTADRVLGEPDYLNGAVLSAGLRFFL